MAPIISVILVASLFSATSSFAQSAPQGSPAKLQFSAKTAVAQHKSAVPHSSTAQTRSSGHKIATQSQAKRPSVNRQPVVVEQFARSESVGSRLGLRSELSRIALNSSAVLVVDQQTGEVLLDKNSDVALPIASITKVMTAVVTLEADLPMNEVITITQSDAQLEKNPSSRLNVGAELTRAELLHLALMSSENRAAQALGRSYPGGLSAFVSAMNEKARELGMTGSSFADPTGLSSNNMSTARDLAKLVHEAYQFPLIRRYSTARELLVRVGRRQQQFINTNALARGDDWELGLSKTGFIRDAGRCLVMQAVIDRQPVIMIMLDAQASQQRLRDAERIRQWLTSGQSTARS